MFQKYLVNLPRYFEEGWSASKLFLPPHLVKHVVCPLEEDVDLGPLVVQLCLDPDFVLGLLGEVLANLRNGEDDLFKIAVATNHLDLGSVGPVKSVSNTMYFSIV